MNLGDSLILFLIAALNKRYWNDEENEHIRIWWFHLQNDRGGAQVNNQTRNCIQTEKPWNQLYLGCPCIFMVNIIIPEVLPIEIN